MIAEWKADCASASCSLSIMSMPLPTQVSVAPVSMSALELHSSVARWTAASRSAALEDSEALRVS